MGKVSHKKFDIISLFVFFLLLASPAFAATITVDAGATDQAVAGVDGDCSLREAISAINTSAVTTDCTDPGQVDTSVNAFGASDEIIISAETITIGITGTREDANATGDFDIDNPVTITGAGAGLTTIDGGTLDRVFHVIRTVAVTFDGVTITGGVMRGGAGIFANGNLTLTNSIVSGNTTNSDNGGIYAGGALTLTNSTVSGNTATSNFGGFYAIGAVTLTNSTVSGNIAGTLGGGIYALGAVTLTNSTVSNNTAGTSYGGIYAANTMTLTNSTIYGNSDAGVAGGVYTSTGAVTINNSIIAGNTGGPDCANNAATWTSGGYNIDSDGTCLALDTGTGDFTADPLVSALANNGGTTETHALTAGSPAIDSGSCVSATDQIGTARPQDGDVDTLTRCDIGAFELLANGSNTLTVTVSGTGTVDDGIAISNITACAGTCADTYDPTATVTLTGSTPVSGESLAWSGCDSNPTTTTCDVLMSGAKNVSVSYGGLGCTDATATNYNAAAIYDDGSCTYAAVSSSPRNSSPYSATGDAQWLIYPADGETGVNPGTAFTWYQLTDDDGDTITYDPQFCDGFESGECTSWSSVTSRTAMLSNPDNKLVATGAVIFAIGFIGAIRTRRGRAFMLALILMASAGAMVACGKSSDDSDSSTSSGALTCDDVADGVECETQSGLSANTEYTWRVVASDGNGGENISVSRTFTTGD